MNTNIQEIKQELEIANEYREEILATGMETCPCCSKVVPINQMTASVTRGVVCWDCDMSLASE